MKKLTALLLVLALILSLASCGSKTVEVPQTEATTIPEETAQVTTEATTLPTEPEPPASLITVTDVFYGNFGTSKTFYDHFHAPEGKDDLFVFFEYANDDENRTMPEEFDTSRITLSVDNTKFIEAAPSPETVTQMGDSWLSQKEYDYFDRYTGFHYAIGYGNLLGGAEPVQMYIRFFVDPGSLDGQESITLNVDGQTAVFSCNDIQHISMPDEMLSIKGDYETEQQLAAFKWRIDKAFMATTFISECSAAFGSDYKSMNTMMKYIFAENTGWGVTIFQNDEPACGFSEVEGITFDSALRKELPSFDLAVILDNYPDQADAIKTYIEDTNTLAQKIVTSGTSNRSVEDLINKIRQEYYDLCAFFEINPIQYDG